MLIWFCALGYDDPLVVLSQLCPKYEDALVLVVEYRYTKLFVAFSCRESYFNRLVEASFDDAGEGGGEAVGEPGGVFGGGGGDGDMAVVVPGKLGLTEPAFEGAFGYFHLQLDNGDLPGLEGVEACSVPAEDVGLSLGGGFRGGFRVFGGEGFDGVVAVVAGVAEVGFGPVVGDASAEHSGFGDGAVLAVVKAAGVALDVVRGGPGEFGEFAANAEAVKFGEVFEGGHALVEVGGEGVGDWGGKNFFRAVVLRGGGGVN